ncbi:trigger factor [Thioalkalivibrio denitrificans]|uniref:Trigger factor n=1 Tax=Thioalkalivibrio denitrificans TaxID=108003 RepID=A0A1V3NVE2_9GAMM|nr:trigger factor [Thioalkalivibrio denitrificans]OOG28696.1 trigger factor [Thioalkalivibrio denitrificans]
MQVSVETISNLQRRMTVQVPAERIDQEVDKRLKSLSKRVRLDGFRPGKVPLKVVQQRYGAGVFQEVVGDVVQRTYQEAIAQEKLQPAGGPSIEPKVMEPGKELEYVATFEVFPQVELADLGDVSVERPRVEITDADVDKVIESLRRQRKEFVAVDRPAQEGDQVTVDFEGRLDGETFEGGKAEAAPVELGSGQMLEAFESQLVGLRPGEEKTLDVPFPEGYPAEHLAGKTAQFDIKVREVREPTLPAVDEAFATSFGIKEGGVEKLREEVRANMTREVDQAVRNRVKGQVMDALYKAHDLELPEALIKDEIERLREQATARFGAQAEGVNLPDELFSEEARRRVALGLIIRELVKAKDLSATPEKVEAELQRSAAGYEDPKQVINYYRSNAQAMSGLEALVLEDEVVDWVLTQGTVTEKPVSFDELMNPQKEGQSE